MWLQETKPECCINYEPLPENIECLGNRICSNFGRLYRLHRQAFIKSPRIDQLAMPKPRAREHRFVTRCPCFLKKNIQIIRLDQRVCTRTEQLSYPRARHLFLFKKQISNLFPPERIENLNRLIRKSLFSLYSRLGNIQPPPRRPPVKKWDKNEWRKHARILKKLAKPKAIKKPPRKPSKRMNLSEMKRYKHLAKPKKSYLIEKPEWTLTPNLRSYRATKRIKDLAQPVVRDTSALYQDLPIEIPETVLKSKASARTQDLAKPNPRRLGQSAPSDLKENAFAIPPNVLKARASPRTKELAEPKQYENKHIREDPYAISKAALNAKATPRTIELAQPKKR